MAENCIRCVILGGGGHAAVVIEALMLGGRTMPWVVLDSNEALWGKELSGVSIRGGDELLPDLKQEGVEGFVVGLGGTGDNGPRRHLFARAQMAGLRPLTVHHPSAVYSSSALVGEGTVILAGSIVGVHARIGRNVIINSGAIVEHDCIIGDHVHIASGAVLASTVCVEEGAHIGAGAVIRQRIKVGAGAVVGAGSVVIRDVASGQTVVGVPAQPLPVRRCR
ncbi:MAG: NeuD/PglB/VioB family sugar acetyltransferase [Nitrospiraceae bacterium]